MDMHTYTQTKEQTGQHGQEHMDIHKVDGRTHMSTYALTLLPRQGPGQNRVNPCSAGGANPMQVKHGEDLVLTKRRFWALA